jgi:hypothetical protein
MNEVMSRYSWLYVMNNSANKYIMNMLFITTHLKGGKKCVHNLLDYCNNFLHFVEYSTYVNDFYSFLNLFFITVDVFCNFVNTV